MTILREVEINVIDIEVVPVSFLHRMVEDLLDERSHRLKPKMTPLYHVRFVKSIQNAYIAMLVKTNVFESCVTSPPLPPSFSDFFPQNTTYFRRLLLLVGLKLGLCVLKSLRGVSALHI